MPSYYPSSQDHSRPPRPAPALRDVGGSSWLTSAAFALLAAMWALRPVWDIDLGWHLALGRYMWEHGWPTVDVLSAARPDAPWTTFQGGYELLVAALERRGGLFAVRLLHAAAVGGGVFLLDRVARHRGAKGWLRVAIVAVALVLYEDRIRVRPHVFHFLFIWWAFLELVRPATALSPLSAGTRQFMWSFLHAPASLWGIALLGAGAVGEPRNRWRWASVAIAAGATALAPGALAGLRGAFGVHTEGELQAAWVPEHGPLWQYFQSGLGAHAYFVVGLVLLSLAFFALRVRRVDGPVLAAAGMAVFSVLIARFAWYALAPALVAMRPDPTIRRPLVSPIVAGFAALALFATDAFLYVVPRYRDLPEVDSPQPRVWATDWQPGAFPEGAANFLHDTGIKGNIFNEVGWGGYLLYRLHPGVRTLTDGRIAFGPEVGELLARDTRLQRGIVLQEASERFGIDLAVRRRGRFLASPPTGWTMLYADSVAEVWARQDDNLPARIRQTRAVGLPSP